MRDGIDAARGFTLIELLVTIVIVAVLAAAVSIALAGSGGERQLEREAERIDALIGYACERAELSGRQTGVSFLASGYAFSALDPEGWKEIADGELRQRRWVAPFHVHLGRDGIPVEITPELPEQPHVVCFASGELTPFRLELTLADDGLRNRLEGEPTGTRTLERRDATR
jgi:general secretion pathway protein H